MKKKWLLPSVMFVCVVILVALKILFVSTPTYAGYNTWSDQDVIYTAPATGNAYYPSAVYDEGGFGGGDKYAMWYSDGDGAFFLTTSPDGVTWGAPTTMVGLTNVHHVQVLYSASCFGTVPCNAGTTKYRMWFWDMGAPTPPYGISNLATAESADGINWINKTIITQNTAAKLVQDPDMGTGWNRGTYGPVNLFYQPSASNTGTEPWDYSYVMYYDGTDGSHEDTGLAYSADGFLWNAYAGNPVLSGTNSGGTMAWNCGSATYGTVYKDFMGYHFWYSGRGQDDGAGGCTFPPSFVGIGSAFSIDGKNWVKDTDSIFNISDGVSYRSGRLYTPSVINDGSGTLRMYFSVKDSVGGPKKIAYATMSTPTPPAPPVYTHNLVNKFVINEDSSPVFSTLIPDQEYVLKDDTDYKLYYAGNDFASINLATSPDGITWTPYPGNPIMSDPLQQEHADVKYFSDGFAGANSGTNFSPITMYYRMWYQGPAGMNIAGWRYAESPDGIRWYNRMVVTQTGTSVTGGMSAQYGIADVVYTPGGEGGDVNKTFRIYVEGQYAVAPYTSNELVVMAYSANGYNWTGYDPTLVGYATPVFGGTLDGVSFDTDHIGWFKVVKNSDTDWQAFYSGGKGSTYVALNGIGYATSTDGINWVRRQTLFTTNDPVAWRNNSVWMPSVVKYGSGYEIFFLGSDNPMTDGSWIWWKLGRAVLTPAPSSDATLTSAIGTVDNGLGTIVNIPNGTTLAVFKTGITPTTGATFEVYEADGTTVATDLASGYKVKVTAEDTTTTKTYTVTVNAASGGNGGISGGSYLTPTPMLTPTCKFADINCDGKVDVFDFNLVMVNWGNNPTDITTDLNSDGKVDVFDFNLLMVNWSL